MTVNDEGSFLKALFCWKGSVWKAIWREFLIYFTFYFALRSILYFVMFRGDNNEFAPLRKCFCLFITQYKLPLELFLGFFINQAVTRWWTQVSLLPWPDEIMAHACSVLHQNDEDTRSRRRSVGRYIVLSIILVYRNISSQVIRKFPTLDNVQACGLLTEEEREIIENSDKDVQYDIPLHWIHEAIRSKVDSTQGSLVFGINSFRNQLRGLTHYNKVSFPLVYTQIATTVVYGIFAFGLLGNLFMEEGEYTNTKYVQIIPFVTLLRFIYNVGWLKVAQHLRNPYGNDDEDVDLCAWIDRHIRLVYIVADHATVNYSENSWKNDDSSFSKVMAAFPPIEQKPNSTVKVKSIAVKFLQLFNFKIK